MSSRIIIIIYYEYISYIQYIISIFVTKNAIKFFIEKFTSNNHAFELKFLLNIKN